MISPWGTWHLNAKDNEINLSKVACNILEYSQKEKFSIDDFKNIVDDTSKEKIRGHLVDLFENEIPFSTELLIRINKKKKWVIISGQTIKVPGGNQFLCVGTIKEWTYSNLMKEELDIIRADVGSEVLHEVMGPMTVIRNSCSKIDKFLKKKEFQKIQDKIFEKHFTTKGDCGGTGIGLDVCFKLLERIGGTIEIDNSAFNTTFLIYLPK